MTIPHLRPPWAANGARPSDPGWIGVLADAVKRAFRKHPGGLGIPAVTINRSADEVYVLCRQFQRLPLLFEDLDRVETSGANRSHWVLKTPGGGRRVWDVEVTQAETGKFFDWIATVGKRHLHGSVRLSASPSNLTEIRVELDRDRSDPGLVTRVLAVPMIYTVLRRLKQVLETGEVLKSDASRHAGPHAAQPSAEPPEPPRATPDRGDGDLATSTTAAGLAPEGPEGEAS
jgi:hypothetical protein